MASVKRFYRAGRGADQGNVAAPLLAIYCEARMQIGISRSFWAALMACAASLPAAAQWPGPKTPGLPRLANGQVNLTAPAPKTADGKPDLSGIWEPEGGKFLQNIAAELKPGDIPFKPEGAALFKARSEAFGKDDPDARCLPSGMPRKDAVPSPYKILQSPGLIVFLYESRTTFRQIFTDGRALPQDPQPTWDGYSVGRWEGETLVVESRGFNGKAWLDSAGHPVSPELHLTERFRRPDLGHLEIEITVDDPAMYTKPWTVKEHPHLLPDNELIEYICNENEKDLSHLIGNK